MTHTSLLPRRNLLRRTMPFVALAMSAAFASVPAWAQSTTGGTAVSLTAPRAGTSIGNQATATYNDGSNIPRDVQSNSVTTTVQQVNALTLIADRNISGAPGAPVAFPHTVTNSGNGTDSYDLTVAANAGFLINPRIFADANQDGVADNDTPITRTPSLQPGEKFNFVIVGTVPANAAAASTGSVNVTATSVSARPTIISATNTDTVTVSNQAVVNVVKSVGAPVNGVYTYTLTYTNNSNVASGTLNLTDNLNAGLTYQPESGKWSLAPAGPVNDAPATDAPGINYTYTGPGRQIVAIITSVPARSSGQVSFSATVNSTTPGAIPNFATYNYGDGSPDNTRVPGTTNTVDVNVNRLTGVTITDDIQTLPVTQGSTVTFTNIVTNTGNSTDTYNITLDPAQANTFPAGTVFQFFQVGGATLLDSNGDGIPDTGPVAPNGAFTVLVRAILPATASANNTPTVFVRATSTNGTRPFAVGTDSVPSISAASVDIINRDAATPGAAGGTAIGTGAYVPAFLGQTRTSGPGATVTFDLAANNTSTRDDNYGLSFTLDPNVALPRGYTVVFKDLNGKVITNTGNVPAGGSFQYKAEVTIPADAAANPTIDFVFAITSGASGATDSIKDRLIVSPVNAITITPNNQGQVFPGSSVNYAHVITNTGNTTQTNIPVAATNSQPNFSSVIYADTNGNGILDPTEQTAGPLTTIPTLAPGAKFPIIVVVFGPSNQFTSGAVNTTTVTTGPVANPTATATDTTTIVAGDVVLTKVQSVNGAAATQGNANGTPGDTITYTVTVRNTGAAPVRNVIVSDNIPPFTTYVASSAAVAAPAPPVTVPVTPAASADASGASTGRGTVRWTIPFLDAGATATVTFQVRINN